MNEEIQPERRINEPNDVVRRLRTLAEAAGVQLAVTACDERTGETLRADGDIEMQTASVIKLAVLVAVYARARDGALSPEERIELAATDSVGGSGVIKELSPGTRLTVHDLAVLMIVVSDNLATNLLIDAVGGIAVVNDVVHGELDLPGITLRRKLTFSDSQRGPLGLASPDALVRLLGGLVAGRVVSAAASAEMLEILGRQQYLDQVPRLFDQRELVDELDPAGRLTVACKTGMIEGVRADAGVLRLGGADAAGGACITYAVMSQASDDGGLDLDSDAALVNAEAGRLIVEWAWPADAGDLPLARHPAARWSQLHRAAGR